jgi:DNA topoisomerase-1
MNLLVVESPTKAKTLKKFLSKDYDVIATMGHIKDLPKSRLSVDVNHNFKPDYVFVEKREKEIADIKSKAKKAKTVYLASDPDREGEAIAAHVRQLIGNGKTKRIVFHEITQSAVEEAVAHPHKVDVHLVDAQIARRVLDRLVGYKLSPLLWRKVRRGLSAGRVQSVAVRLIVERQREIDAFKPVEYWEISTDVKAKAGKFNVALFKVDNKIPKIKNKQEADNVVTHLKKAKYFVNDITKREVRSNPYPPFTTSTMTQAAARLFAWPAKRTMSVAQTLYEQGLITYHRTDSLNLSTQAVSAVREYIEQKYSKEYLPANPKFYKTQTKQAQEAHEAIRPTNVNHGDKLTGNNKKLYDLIKARFIASQMNPAIYDETRIQVIAKNRSTMLLRTTGRIEKFKGWKAAYRYTSSKEDNILPEVVKDESLQLIKVHSDQKFTQPPPYFNEASLIKTLEKLGIGRPSTYAPIISTIQLRKYVEKDEGKFVATSVGKAVNDFLISNFPDVFEYEFTAGMEDGLDRVAEGKQKWQKIIGDFYRPFDKKLDSVGKNAKRVKIETEKLGKKCPECKTGELVVRLGRFGKFVSCSRFPDCRHTEKYQQRVGKLMCPKCKTGKVIIKITGKGRKFYGCSNYPDCDWASWKDPRLENKDKKKKTKKAS